MKTRLLHIRANVADLKRAIEWYEGILGFKVEGTFPEENPIYAQFEAEEGATFSIEEDENVPTHGRFNFYTTHVDQMWEELKGKVSVVEELWDTPWGSRKFTIRDLDGNELCFVND